MRRRKRGGERFALEFCLASAVAGAALLGSPAHGQISINTHSNSTTSWTISNGALTVNFDPNKNNITSVVVAGHSDNILDPANSQLYPEFAGTPFGSGTQSYNYQTGSNYIDFSTTTASTGTSTNPVTYAFHYVMYANDPAIHMYEVVNHSAADPATSVGQGQFLMRVDPAKFNFLYQANTSPNNLGITTTQLPNSTALLNELNGTNGYNASVTVTNATTGTMTTFNPRLDLPEVLDLNGDTDLIAQLGRNFLNKYDYSSYEQFRLGQTEVGPTYAVSSIFANHDTFTGGPTKQNLQFTNNILMVEFLSGHYGSGSINPGDPGTSYTPPQGVSSSKLFGPYIFRVTPVNGETPGQLYTDAINSAPSYPALYAQDTTLLANGYVTYDTRGALQLSAASSAGWSSNINNNTVVLSDPNTNFQESHQGYQYWAQIGANGQASITSIAPGTYRMSIYQYGQWGETRIDGVQIANGKFSAPQNVQFTPENFGTSIWTLGTPDRSAHEFLNGHFTSGPYTGQDNRNYFGSYNYWQEMADLGNNGKVVYYATSVGATPATNDPNKWIANQWRSFDPALYNPATGLNANSTAGTVGLYPSIAPSYVGNPATYTGLPWEIHFATTSTLAVGKNYVVLSVGLAAAEASLTITLNGHSDVWHFTNNSDPMIRSGQAGYYQWIAYEWPIADLATPGSDNVLTYSVSQTDGVMYDAQRLELAANSANPTITGWHDYFYVNSNGSANAANADDSLGLTALNLQVAAAATWKGQADGTSWNAGNWVNNVNTAATYINPDTVTLDDSAPGTATLINLTTAITPGSITVNSSANNYTFTGAGSITTASLTKNGSSLLTVAVPITINGPLAINSGTVVFSGPANATGAISGAGNLTVTSGASLTSDTVHINTLTINGAHTIRPNGAGTSSVTSLVLAGAPGAWTGRLDLTNNNLIVAGGGGSNVPDQIRQAANLATWNGTGGITSSSAAAAATSSTATALAYATGAEYTAATGQTTFQSQSFNPTDTLIMYTLAGDATMDGTVTFADFLALQNHYNQPGDWSQGDWNYDGQVTFADFLILQNNYNKTLATSPILPSATSDFSLQTSAFSPTPAPEAATLLLLAAALPITLLRRRRQP